MKQPRDIPERFWSKVHKTESCWLWTASVIGNGYGGFYADGAMRAAHRVAWQLVNGPIPDGLWVLHDCPGGDNRRCVNPDHLWLGTNADNVTDKVAKGRQARGPAHSIAVKHGEASGRSKLTEAEVREIRALCAIGGLVYRDIGALYNVSATTVGEIRHRKYWQHVA